MKNFVLAFIALFAVSSVTAEEITLIRSGSDSGSTAQRSNHYAVALEEQGYTVNRPSSMPYELLVERFLATDEPVIMPWISNLGSRIPEFFTKDQFISIEYSSPMYVCYVKDGVAKADATIGAHRSYPAAPVEAMGFTKVIPYKNNGAIINAAIAGEVDAVYVNAKGAGKVKKTGMQCEQIPGLTQHAFLLGRNIDIDKMRVAAEKAYQTPEFAAWLANGKAVIDAKTGDIDKDFEIATESHATWGNR